MHWALMIEIEFFDRRKAISCRCVEMLEGAMLVSLGLSVLGLVKIGLVARSGRRDWRLAFLVFLFGPC